MKKIFTALFIFMISIIATTAVHADNQVTSYSVTPYFSQHQTKGVDNFFDIRWTPSDKENFELKITNNTDKTKAFEIMINKAQTNRNGIIDYSNSTPEKSDAVYKLTQMIKLPKEVTVAPKSSQTIHGTISFPTKKFNGILMAGLHFSEKKSADKNDSVSNTVAYNIPFVVRGNIDRRPTPKLTLDQVKMAKATTTATGGLNATITNQRQNLLKNVKVTTTIKNTDDKSLKRETRKVDITPETTFDYPVQLPKNLKAGKYKLVLKLQHGNDKWNFEQKFKVKAADLRDTSSKPTQGIKPVMIGLLVGGLIVIIGCGILLKRYRK